MTTNCQHPNLVPFMQVAGKRVWQGDSCYIDWTSNIINAHFLKVTKYYCPDCGQLINSPSEVKEDL